MISFEEALQLVKSCEVNTSIEIVSYSNCLGRVLAEDVVSDLDMPPFDKSAVDGFACKMTDIGRKLTIVETIPAGKHPEMILKDDQCSRIMTGAMIPHGADCVLMVEHTEITANGNVRFLNETTNTNICFKGEDIKKGQIVIKKGILIKPEHISVMATVGYINPVVYKRPKVSIISTGNELIEPNVKPDLCKIRNCNSYQLAAQCGYIGIHADYLGIAVDNQITTEKIISEALEKSDIVLLSGGVSMGDFDYVPEVLKKLGIKIIFQSIAVQPGKPTLFGTIEGKYIFGLPGNPVSAFIQFELLVKPLIYKIMGQLTEKPDLKLVLGVDYKRRNSERKAIVPVIFDNDGFVYPVEFHGSAHVNSIMGAHGLMFVEKGCNVLLKGEKVNVRQF